MKSVRVCVCLCRHNHMEGHFGLCTELRLPLGSFDQSEKSVGLERALFKIGCLLFPGQSKDGRMTEEWHFAFILLFTLFLN